MLRKALSLPVVCFAVVLASCTDRGDITQPADDTASYAVAEAGANGTSTVGNDRFQFLPPLGSPAEPFADFDPDYLPLLTVELCVLDGDECDWVADSSTHLSEGGKRLRVDEEEEHYLAVLSTDGIPNGSWARISVKAGSVILGQIDLAVRRPAGGRGEASDALRVNPGASVPVSFWIEVQACLNLLHVSLDGAEGEPGDGSHWVRCGASVDYSYRAVAGYEMFRVQSGGIDLPHAGTITPSGPVFLTARAVEHVALSSTGAQLKDQANQLYGGGSPAEDYQASLDLLAILVQEVGHEEAMRQSGYAFRTSRRDAGPSAVAAVRRELAGRYFRIWSDSEAAPIETAMAEIGSTAATGFGPRATQVIHVNGIFNDEEMAAANAARLRQALFELGKPSLISEVGFVYNPTLNWRAWTATCGLADTIADFPTFMGGLRFTGPIFEYAAGLADPLDLTGALTNEASDICRDFESNKWLNDGGESVELYRYVVAQNLAWPDGGAGGLPDYGDETTLRIREKIESTLPRENILLVPHSQGNLYVQSVLQGGSFSAADEQRIAVLALATPLNYPERLTSRLGGFKGITVYGDAILAVNPLETNLLQTELSQDAFGVLEGAYAQELLDWENAGCYSSPITGSAACPPPGYRPLEVINAIRLHSVDLHNFQDSYLSRESPTSVNAIRTATFDLVAGLMEAGVEFEDQNLEAAVREALDIPFGPIMRDDMLSLTLLNAENRGIRSLAGIEAATNLRSVRLVNNEIVDLRPLEALQRLEFITLYENLFSDITPLAALPSLHTISVGSPNLRSIEGITAASLHRLSIRNSPVESIRSFPASSIVNLDLTSVPLRDWSGLVGQEVFRLYLFGVGEAGGVVDVDALASMTLETLIVRDDKDVDWEGIGARVRATSLSTLNTGVTTEWLGFGGMGLTGHLELGNNQITDLEGIDIFNGIQGIYIWNNPLTNIRPLLGLTIVPEGATIGISLHRLDRESICEILPELSDRGWRILPNTQTTISCEDPPPPAGQAPSVFTESAGSITSTSFAARGNVNPNGLQTVAWVEWSTNSSMAGAQSSPEYDRGDGTLAQTLTEFIYDLEPERTYYYRLAARNSAGETLGNIRSVTTAPTVTPDLPDISVDSLSILSLTATEMEIRVTIRNVGTAPLRQSWLNEVFVGSSSIWGFGEEILLKQDWMGTNLSPGQAVTFEMTVDVSRLAAGSVWYVYFWADRANNVEEEGNGPNLRRSEASVTIP